MRVLFVYPNIIWEPTPQMGIASLSATLKAAGHSCQLYDATFIPPSKRQDQLIDKITSFRPQLIAISCRSLEWDFVERLLEVVRPFGIPTVIGGTHPTVAPEKVIEKVDMLIMGEGERALLELCNRLERAEDISSIQNLWLKRNGTVIRNDLRPLMDMDELEFPDWGLFARRHFTESYVKSDLIDWKIEGLQKINVVGCFEASRGCPYRCTYCINAYQQDLYKGKGRYHREKSPQRMIMELVDFKRRFGLDYVYFIDETFFLNTQRIQLFSDLYKKEVGVPFGFMARPETVTRERLQALRNAGAVAVGIGIESGDQDFRVSMLNRKTSQRQVTQSFKIAREYGLRTSSFNMVGLPFEDKNLVKKTMELNRVIKPDTMQVSVFYPFKGSKLYEACLQNGFIDVDAPSAGSYFNTSVLSLPTLSKSEIARLRLLLAIFTKTKLPWSLMLLLARVQPLWWLFENSFSAWPYRRRPKTLVKKLWEKTVFRLRLREKPGRDSS